MTPPAEILAAIRAEQPQGVQVVEVPEGAAGTDATLEAMSRFARAGSHSPAIIYLAREIVRGVPSLDYAAELEAIYRWVRKHIRYTQDPRGQEWVQTPSYTAWVAGQGDCDDHATLIAALALSLGHGAAFRVVATDPSRPTEASHVYAVVGVRDRQEGPMWVALDTTQPEELGWEPPAELVFGKWDHVVAPL